MFCPRDQTTLQRFALAGGGNGWACEQCSSRAVTLPALRRNLDGAFLRALTTALVTADADTDLPCPSCTTPMRDVLVEADGSRLHLEVCRQCALAWFDADELESAPVPSKPERPQRDPRIVELEQRLAIADVEEMARRSRDQQPAGLARLPALLGMPVELEASGLAGWPWGTWGVAVVVATVSCIVFAHPQLLPDLALVPDQLWQRPLGLVTSFFVHGGWLHLLGNLWFLIVFGDNLELHYGRVRWAMLLAAATLAGGLLHALAEPHSGLPCVGASGGISGLIVCYALTLPQARLGVYLWPHRYLRPQFVAFSARTGLIVWAALQLWLLLLQLDGHGRISALAHVGGGLVGVGGWLSMRTPQ